MTQSLGEQAGGAGVHTGSFQIDVNPITCSLEMQVSPRVPEDGGQSRPKYRSAEAHYSPR